MDGWMDGWIDGGNDICVFVVEVVEGGSVGVEWRDCGVVCRGLNGEW